MKMKRMQLALLCCLMGSLTTSASLCKRPNVVLIVCDDLNDNLGHLGGHVQARTPHLDRLDPHDKSLIKAASFSARSNIPSKNTEKVPFI